MSAICRLFIVVFAVGLVLGHASSVDVDVLARLKTLEEEGRVQRMTMKRLESVVQNQTNIISDLQAKVDNQEQLILALLKEQQSARQETPIENEQKEMKSTLKTSKHAANNIQKQSKQGTRQTRMLFERGVAFQARIDKYPVTHIGLNQNIVFDVVITNLGGAYHPNHGVFIAPVAGIYIFSTSVLSERTPHVEYQANLVKNGTLLARVYGHADTGHDQGSVTVVTTLVQGDEVWVSLRGPADDSIWGDGFTSFTGCLIMYT